MNSLFSSLRSAIGRRIGSRWIQLLLALKTEWKFAELYGDFHFGKSFNNYAIKGLAQESGKIYGAVVKFLKDIPEPITSILLPGENNAVKPVYADLLKVTPDKIITVGILDDMDVEWNFEQDPPAIGPFQCIVSQSMIEHLLDPYKHMRDCAALLAQGGYLVVHTVMPGFNYHRYPIDCLRFYPDWFEEVAKRIGFSVQDRYIHNSRITYKFYKLFK